MIKFKDKELDHVFDCHEAYLKFLKTNHEKDSVENRKEFTGALVNFLLESNPKGAASVLTGVFYEKLTDMIEG